ncbi:MAG: response regulator with CheY-like receiver domain and winged-helix DNA-binding domain [Frankiales bacterium]|nr:response regulator with CheY-like receiver domain and winged-helix DNA-binding domain [Frankiales bacterium]
MRLLLVDDEPGLSRALARGLAAEGFAVDVRADGPSGLQQAVDEDYDVVLLDVMLPGMSGYDVVRSMRRQGVWTPVLMISAKDGEHDQADGLDVGADDWLTKPFSFVVLVARVRALLRRSAPPRPVVLRAGDLALDPAAHEVRQGESVVELTSREFALLEYLVRRAGRVVSKGELRDHVWDSAATDGLNVVEVYVAYLRKKLGPAAVETVRGAGYRVPA